MTRNAVLESVHERAMFRSAFHGISVGRWHSGFQDGTLSMNFSGSVQRIKYRLRTMTSVVVADEAADEIKVGVNNQPDLAGAWSMSSI